MTRFNEQKHFPRRNVNQFGVLLYLESNDLIVALETERVQQVTIHHWLGCRWRGQLKHAGVGGWRRCWLGLEYPQSWSAARAVLASSRLKLSSATKPDLLWLITSPALKPQMKCKWWCRLMRSRSPARPHQPRGLLSSSQHNIEF